MIFFKKILTNSPEYLLYLFVFLLPWQTRWIVRGYFIGGDIFEYGRISLYGFDIILIVMLLIFLFFDWRKLFLFKFNKKILNIRYWMLEKKLFIAYCLLFIAYCLLMTILAEDKIISFYWSARMFLGFGLFYLVQKINFSRIRLAIVMVISGAIQGLLGITQFISQNIWQSKWLGMAGQSAEELGASVVEFGLERWLRAYGSLPHPNIFGALLVIAFLAVIYLITKVEDKYHKLFLIFSVSFIWLGILFSYSRGAWLVGGLIYFMGIGVMFRVKERWLKKFGLGLFGYGILLITVFVIATWPIVATRLNIKGTVRLEAKSTTERINSYQQAREIIGENWLIGTGIGNYTLALKEKYPTLLAWDIQPAHNTILLMMAELGLGGLIFIILMGWQIIKKLRNKEIKKLVKVFLFFCFFVFLMLDHFWWTSATGLYVMWLVGGLGIKLIRERKLEIS